jgi:hypothetical protein
MATWQPRKDPIIWATLDIDAAQLLTYIADVRAATGRHVTAMDLVGRAAGKVFEGLPGLNGRIVFGNFVASPTIDAFFVVSLRTDPATGALESSTDLSGTVVRRVNEKTPWVIAGEIADRAGRIRGDRDTQFKQAKAVAKALPPVVLGPPMMDAIAFVTESLQLPLPILGMEVAVWIGSDQQCRHLRTGLRRGPWPTFCHVPIGILMGAVTDKLVARDGKPVVRPCCRSPSAWTTVSSTAIRRRRWRGYSLLTSPTKRRRTRFRQDRRADHATGALRRPADHEPKTSVSRTCRTVGAEPSGIMVPAAQQKRRRKNKPRSKDVSWPTEVAADRRCLPDSYHRWRGRVFAHRHRIDRHRIAIPGRREAR